MSTALVQCFYRRPLFHVEPVSDAGVIYDNGRVMSGTHGPVTISVSTHDQYYLRLRAAWKALLRDRLSVRVTAEYEAWKAREQDWYARLGLFPPTVRRGAPDRRRRGTCRRGHRLEVRRDRFRKRFCRVCDLERRRAR